MLYVVKEQPDLSHSHVLLKLFALFTVVGQVRLFFAVSVHAALLEIKSEL